MSSSSPQQSHSPSNYVFAEREGRIQGSLPPATTPEIYCLCW
jgi:hypothetical protein